MLQESIEEMRNTLPRLNQILVTTRATVIRLEQERVELERKEKSLIGSIQAALKEGSPEARKLAEDDAMHAAAGAPGAHRDARAARGGEERLRERPALGRRHQGASSRPAHRAGRKAIAESKKAEVMRSAASALWPSSTPTAPPPPPTSTSSRSSRRWPSRRPRSRSRPAGSTPSASSSSARRAQIQAQSILSEFEVEMGLKKPDAVQARRRRSPTRRAGAGGAAAGASSR